MDMVIRDMVIGDKVVEDKPYLVEVLQADLQQGTNQVGELKGKRLLDVDQLGSFAFKHAVSYNDGQLVIHLN